MPDIIWLVPLEVLSLTIDSHFFRGRESSCAIDDDWGLGVVDFLWTSIIVSIDHPFAGLVKVEPLGSLRYSRISAAGMRSHDSAASDTHESAVRDSMNRSPPTCGDALYQVHRP